MFLRHSVEVSRDCDWMMERTEHNLPQQSLLPTGLIPLALSAHTPEYLVSRRTKLRPQVPLMEERQ